MRESIKNRINEIIDEGLPILTIEGTNDIRRENPFGSTHCSNDETPDIFKAQLLRYFGDRGAEYIVDKTYASGKDFTNYNLQCGAIPLAFNYGIKTKIFDENTESATFEIHAITDEELNKTHYFILPHKYFFEKSQQAEKKR